MSSGNAASVTADAKALLDGGEHPRKYYRSAIRDVLEIVNAQSAEIEALKDELEKTKDRLRGLDYWSR